MPVKYNSRKLIPVQTVGIRKSYNQKEDGEHIGTLYNINIAGRLVFFKGSPTGSGTFWTASGYPDDESVGDDSRLTAILRKQEALRDLFADEGKLLEVEGFDGGAPIACNPRLRGEIQFQPGPWTNYCDYTVDLEADVLYVNGTGLTEDEGDLTNYHISRFDEEWNFEPADEEKETFRLSRRLSAIGKRFYDINGNLTAQAWENARSYVFNKAQLGIDITKAQATGVYNFDSINAYNYNRTQAINEAGGSFAIQENWLCFQPIGSGYAATEDFTVTARTSLDGLITVTVDGSVRGLEVRDNTTFALQSTKYAQASGKYYNEIGGLIYPRASGAVSQTIHGVPIGTSIGRNEKTGVISYTQEFNNRPQTQISAALTENVSISFDNPTQVIAVQSVIARPTGSIIQDMLTFTPRRKTVAVEASFTPKNMTSSPTMPDTNTFISGYAPNASFFFKDRDNENWDETRGRYSRQVSWIWVT